MKYFVTGATGFVGSHLVDKLISEGHEVYSLVRSEKKAKSFNLKGHFILGSLKSEGKIEWLDQLPLDIDVVYHIAGIVHSANIQDFYEVNTSSTENLFRQLQQRYKKLHLIFVSSLAAGGPSALGSLREMNKADQPVSTYGHSKLKAEEAITKLNELFDITILRPPLILGPRDPAILDIYKMVKTRIITGPGLGFLNKEFSYIYVSDLIEILYLTSIKKVTGTFYTAHKETLKFINILDAVKSSIKVGRLFYLSIPTPVLKLVAKIINFLPISNRLTEDKVNELIQPAWTCQSLDLFDKLSFEPEVSFKEATIHTANDYKARGWI